METTAPQTSVPTPEEVLKAIEAAKNRITILESEEGRLLRLKASIEADINTKSLFKSELEKNIAELREKEAKLQVNNEEAEKSLLSTKGEMEKSITELGRVNEEIKTAKEGLDQERRDLDASKSDFAIARKSAADRERAILQGEEELRRRKSILQEALEKI